MVDSGGVLHQLLEVWPGGVAACEDVEGVTRRAEGVGEVTLADGPRLLLCLESADEFRHC